MRPISVLDPPFLILIVKNRMPPTYGCLGNDQMTITRPSNNDLGSWLVEEYIIAILKGDNPE
jgi:hypothetical protein